MQHEISNMAWWSIYKSSFKMTGKKKKKFQVSKMQFDLHHNYCDNFSKLLKTAGYGSIDCHSQWPR